MSTPMTLGAPVLEARDLTASLPTDQGLLEAVNGVSFTLRAGRTLGLVGESGSGKSLTSKMLLRLNDKKFRETGTIALAASPTSGEEIDADEIDLMSLRTDGPVIRSIRGRRIAMIFQEPMTAFSPLYTIGNQIMEVILLHRTSDPARAREICLEMMRKVGIADAERRIDQYPHEFSGGMRQRAMIAMALSCEPDILIADEPTTALDVTIQAQVLDLMRSLQDEYGMAILFITHDLGIVAQVCDEVAVMYLGRIVEQAPVRDIFHNPQHPYTQGLLASIPRPGLKRTERLASIPGPVPQPIGLAPSCGFASRCAKRIEGVCDARIPATTDLGGDHTVRCFLHSDAAEGAKK